jgi:hypothetical protein
MDAKTITIDPLVFKIPTYSRKKRGRNVPNNPEIKVKSTTKQTKASTLKRNLLKLFRNKYEENLKHNTIKTLDKQNEDVPVKGDFESSLEYHKDLTNTTMKSKPTNISTINKYDPFKKVNNSTLKCYNPGISPHIQNMPLPPIFDLPISRNTEPVVINLTPPPQVPQYGCLKQGTLPTYRTWKHCTQKRNSNGLPNIPQQNRNSITNFTQISPNSFEKEIDNRLKEVITKDEWENHNKKLKSSSTLNCPKRKQKRIVRRTYHVGKSKQHPLISVLVSNRTIRNVTNLKKAHLKQTPLHEVKKYLIKNGFIKIGTNSPPDILRQMYESANMVCGELKNHNSDNLLYNYFNTPEEESY